ncbi:hypothetical protein AVEN_145128-1 [Araneus ventricosus]|uniref:Uncharacterized protein n=1 Tax=Araneus ventricosus TaxID=182803 RepID=A0A4Y2GQI3_ARAVE|nr:hypothetical protein AVEN_145128-1 [Araneus ventricosus]
MESSKRKSKSPADKDDDGLYAFLKSSARPSPRVRSPTENHEPAQGFQRGSFSPAPYMIADGLEKIVERDARFYPRMALVGLVVVVRFIGLLDRRTYHAQISSAGVK